VKSNVEVELLLAEVDGDTGVQSKLAQPGGHHRLGRRWNRFLEGQDVYYEPMVNDQTIQFYASCGGAACVDRHFWSFDQAEVFSEEICANQAAVGGIPVAKTVRLQNPFQAGRNHLGVWRIQSASSQFIVEFMTGGKVRGIGRRDLASEDETLFSEVEQETSLDVPGLEIAVDLGEVFGCKPVTQMFGFDYGAIRDDKVRLELIRHESPVQENVSGLELVRYRRRAHARSERLVVTDFVQAWAELRVSRHCEANQRISERIIFYICHGLTSCWTRW